MPELFSIHRAAVSNATDFAVFTTLQPSGWDVMVHSTQLDEAFLVKSGARTLGQGYPKGMKCWVKVSAVDGYSSKAKLQGSIKYVDQVITTRTVAAAAATFARIVGRRLA